MKKFYLALVAAFLVQLCIANNTASAAPPTKVQRCDSLGKAQPLKYNPSARETAPERKKTHYRKLVLIFI